MSIVYVNPYDEKCEKIIKENLELFFDENKQEINDLYNKQLENIIKYLEQFRITINKEDFKEYIILKYKLHLLILLKTNYNNQFKSSCIYYDEFGKFISKMDKDYIHINYNIK